MCFFFFSWRFWGLLFGFSFEGEEFIWLVCAHGSIMVVEAVTIYGEKTYIGDVLCCSNCFDVGV